VAEGHHELGDYDTAIEILQIMISLDELGQLEPAVYRTLAKCFAARGNSDDAVEVLKRALVRYPLDVNLSRDLAKLFMKNGETKRANEVLLNAFWEHPSSQSLFDDLYANNCYNEVCSTLESILKRGAAKEEHFDALVMASRKHQNSLQYAIKILEKTRRNIKPFSKALHKMFDLYLETGKKSKGIIRRNTDPYSKALHKTLFDLYLETGETSKGLNVLQSATKQFPDSLWPWLLLAKAYKSLGDIKSMDETISSYKRRYHKWDEGEKMNDLEVSYVSQGTSTTVSFFEQSLLSRAEARR
jgi:tetratricopeptide (TPR) repeat protein